MIMARLKWVYHAFRDPIYDLPLFFCAYAPTAKTPPAVRSQFLEQLQDVLDDIPQDDTLVMLSDFNARVGMFDPAYGLWHRTICRY